MTFYFDQLSLLPKTLKIHTTLYFHSYSALEQVIALLVSTSGRFIPLCEEAVSKKKVLGDSFLRGAF